MDAGTTNRVTAAIATARAKLKDGVDIGVFSGRPTAAATTLQLRWGMPQWATVRQWVLSIKLSVPLKEGEKPGQPIYDDEQAKSVIAKARAGDALADDLLRKIACKALREGREVMPPNLAEYISEVLANGRRPGRPGAPQKFERDTWIYGAVEKVRKLGFNATRNVTSEHASACSIVTTALAELGVALSEKSVERIWEETSVRYSILY